MIFLGDFVPFVQFQKREKIDRFFKLNKRYQIGQIVFYIHKEYRSDHLSEPEQELVLGFNSDPEPGSD